MTYKKKRGKNPTERTKNLLYIAAGGRCQICNKEVLFNKNYCLRINAGNVAHIVGASKDGPRGNEESMELSQDQDNLMLLCPECHILIDRNTNIFTSEFLIKTKNSQEERVKQLLKTLDKPTSIFLLFTSNIKNTSVLINKNSVISAMITDGMIPYDIYGISVSIDSKYNCMDEIYWNYVDQKIDNEIFRYNNFLKDCNADILSVFPLAPIPMIIKMGYLLSDKLNIRIFQKFREPDSWEWKNEGQTNNFYCKDIYQNEHEDIAIVFAISSSISLDRINSIKPYGKVYIISSERQGVDAINSKKDLESFWKTYLNVCDEIKNNYNVSEVDVFPVVPVSAAFEIGRRYIRGVYPKFNIYEENDGFLKTLSIGGEFYDK